MAVYTTIDDPSAYFQTTLYTGNGSTNAITNSGNSDLQPDWVWIKKRSATENHALYDSVRGTTKTLYSNLNEAEYTEATSLTAFGSDGFTLGADGIVNANTGTYVSWNWKMGTTSGITTGGASVTPSGYSFSATAGQSVITWTGTGSNLTVPHGLGTALGTMFVKCRSHTGDWVFFHKTMGGAYGMELPSTSAKQNTTAWFNSTAPDADKFTIGTNGNVNTSGRSYVAYCFADVQGYSKFGSYTGNGNVSGTFIYTGHKSSYLMIKRTDSDGQWRIWDNKRNTFNPANTNLQANENGADYTDNAVAVDFLANGIKTRNTEAEINASGGTYVYMSFAENPFVTSTGVPTTAR